MPGPFPGMDPYLEAPGFWEDCHDRLIFHMGSMLSELLPPSYAALFRQRVELVLAGRDVVPDLAVTRDPGEAVSVAAPSRSPDPALLIRVAEEEALERYLEIVRIPGEELVTVVEVSSPTNKQDPRGRDAYLRKQRSVLGSEVNLVEIDLLRGGAHWTSVPEHLLWPYRPYDTMVCVSRGRSRDLFECYLRTVRDPLPSISIPLAASYPELTFDLQSAFSRAYDEGRYARRVDYTRPLHPPLRREDEEWARALLYERGLLPPGPGGAA